jgi:hypothetical protein
MCKNQVSFCLVSKWSQQSKHHRPQAMMPGILSGFSLGGPQFIGIVLDQMTEPVTSFTIKARSSRREAISLQNKENSLLVFLDAVGPYKGLCNIGSNAFYRKSSKSYVVNFAMQNVYYIHNHRGVLSPPLEALSTFSYRYILLLYLN